MNYYADRITEGLRAAGLADPDAALVAGVEEFMRTEYGVLDALGRADYAREAHIALATAKYIRDEHDIDGLEWLRERDHAYRQGKTERGEPLVDFPLE